ncbi:MAG: hypothetical protein VX699_00455, partial [Myxococcota bacterium]|nr:hypothetical protein [Myxococcota bacterium]
RVAFSWGQRPAPNTAGGPFFGALQEIRHLLGSNVSRAQRCTAGVLLGLRGTSEPAGHALQRGLFH